LIVGETPEVGRVRNSLNVESMRAIRGHFIYFDPDVIFRRNPKNDFSI
jgi:hypothetical protein